MQACIPQNLHTHSLLMKEHNFAVSQLKVQITTWIKLQSSYDYRANLNNYIPMHQVQYPHTFMFQKNLKWNLQFEYEHVWLKRIVSSTRESPNFE